MCSLPPCPCGGHLRCPRSSAPGSPASPGAASSLQKHQLLCEQEGRQAGGGRGQLWLTASDGRLQQHAMNMLCCDDLHKTRGSKGSLWVNNARQDLSSQGKAKSEVCEDRGSPGAKFGTPHFLTGMRPALKAPAIMSRFAPCQADRGSLPPPPPSRFPSVEPCEE